MAENAAKDLGTLSASNSNHALPNEKLADAEDAEMLAKMGYKQELKRTFKMIEVFGIAFSIMGLLPSIASTLSFSIPAGPVGMVWGWFLASMFIFIVSVAMADLGSAMPTSGGLYWWTHFFASPKTRNPLSFLVGYSNTLGLVGGLCSIDYGFALMFTATIGISRDGNWKASNGEVYAVFLACVLCHGILASISSRIMGNLQTVFVVANLILIFATIIALPVGLNGSPLATPVSAAVNATLQPIHHNSGHYIFAQNENLTTWPQGWAFMLAWLSPIWTIGGIDSCVHMAEEANNAARAVPYGMMMSTGSCWILGFIIMIVISACIDQNLSNVLDSEFGQPMAQIYYDSIGKQGALGLMSLLFIVQFMMGLSILVAASRQSWAFSRDGALPFSSFFRPVSARFGYIPLRTIWGCVFVAAILGLLALIAPAAANALFSLAVAGNNLAWLVPIFCRVWWGQKKFVPGPFYTGRFSTPIAWTAITFLVFGIILAMFPTGGPNPNNSDMNYTIVINAAVWGGALLYYYTSAKYWFKGPKMTLDVDAMTEEQQKAFAEEGLEIHLVKKTDTLDEKTGGNEESV